VVVAAVVFVPLVEFVELLVVVSVSSAPPAKVYVEKS